MALLKFKLVLILFFIAWVWGIPVTVTQSGFKFYDTNYITFANLTSLHNEESGKSMSSLRGILVHPWGDNVTISFTFYKYSNNEYRPTIFAMKFRLCQLISNDQWLGSVLSEAGLKKFPCPLPSGPYNLVNMTGLQFPQGFPFKKGKIVFKILLTQNNTAIAEGEVFLDIEKFEKKEPKP